LFTIILPLDVHGTSNSVPIPEARA
jgi:hypothetical protein